MKKPLIINSFYFKLQEMAIGLECFYRQHQRALDRFVFNHRNLAILKRETKWDGWTFIHSFILTIHKHTVLKILYSSFKLTNVILYFSETWGYDLNYYAKIFNFAAVYGIRLVGLNAPLQVRFS